jgi:hypothetical protein
MKAVSREKKQINQRRGEACLALLNNACLALLNNACLAPIKKACLALMPFSKQWRSAPYFEHLMRTLILRSKTVSTQAMSRILLLFLLFYGTTAMAQKATIEVTIEPKRAFVGEPLHLSINLGLGGTLEKIEVPTLEGLDVVAGQWPPRSPNVFIRGGFFEVPLADVYLSATKPGNLVFGKVRITVDGQTVESAPISIESLERPNTTNSAPSSQQVDRVDNPLYGLPESPTEALVLHAVADRDQVYMGGVATVSYWLLVRPGVRLSNLSIKKPEAKNAIVRTLVDFENQNISKRELTWGGTPYVVFLLGRMAFIPLEEKPLVISPLVISALAGGVFGQGVERPSESVEIAVKPLPAGKPAASASLVGTFQMTLSSPVKEAVVGEAFPVTLVVSGNGDLSSYEPKAFASVKGARARPPAIKNDEGADQERTLLARVEAQYFIVPEKPGPLTLEAPSLAVFDPQTNTWSTLTAPSLSIQVSGAAASNTALLNLRASRDTLQGDAGSSLGWLTLLLMLLIPPILLGGTFTVAQALQKQRDQQRPFLAAHRALESAERAKEIIAFYAHITTLIVSASEAKTGERLQGKTWRELGVALAAKTSEDTTKQALSLLEKADQARYAPKGAAEEERTNSLQAARHLLQTLEHSS